MAGEFQACSVFFLDFVEVTLLVDCSLCGTPKVQLRGG